MEGDIESVTVIEDEDGTTTQVELSDGTTVTTYEAE